MNVVDWEFMKRLYGFVLNNSSSAIKRRQWIKNHVNSSEETLILVSAYEKFENLIIK